MYDPLVTVYDLCYSQNGNPASLATSIATLWRKPTLSSTSDLVVITHKIPESIANMIAE